MPTRPALRPRPPENADEGGSATGPVIVGNGGSFTSKVTAYDAYRNPAPQASTRTVSLSKNTGIGALAPTTFTIPMRLPKRPRRSRSRSRSGARAVRRAQPASSRSMTSATRGTGLSFQFEEDSTPPEWPPSAGAQHMMMHLDLGTDDLDGAVLVPSRSAPKPPNVNHSHTFSSCSTLTVTRSVCSPAPAKPRTGSFVEQNRGHVGGRAAPGLR